jgi:hypothetical protein
MPEAAFARVRYSLEFACHHGTDVQEWASRHFDSPWPLTLTDRVPWIKLMQSRMQRKFYRKVIEGTGLSVPRKAA